MWHLGIDSGSMKKKKERNAHWGKMIKKTKPI